MRTLALAVTRGGEGGAVGDAGAGRDERRGEGALKGSFAHPLMGGGVGITGGIVAQALLGGRVGLAEGFSAAGSGGRRGGAHRRNCWRKLCWEERHLSGVRPSSASEASSWRFRSRISPCTKMQQDKSGDNIVCNDACGRASSHHVFMCHSQWARPMAIVVWLGGVGRVCLRSSSAVASVLDRHADWQ